MSLYMGATCGAHILKKKIAYVLIYGRQIWRPYINGVDKGVAQGALGPIVGNAQGPPLCRGRRREKSEKPVFRYQIMVWHHQKQCQTTF